VRAVRMRLYILAAVLAFTSGIAHAQCRDESSEPIASVGSAVDAAVSHDGFAEAFLAAFAGGSHADKAALAEMKRALSHERGAKRDAAQKIYDHVKYDGE